MITDQQIQRLRPAVVGLRRQFVHYETPHWCNVYEPTTTPKFDVRGWYVWAGRIDSGATARITVHDLAWHLARECTKEKANDNVRRHAPRPTAKGTRVARRSSRGDARKTRRG